MCCVEVGKRTIAAEFAAHLSTSPGPGRPGRETLATLKHQPLVVDDHNVSKPVLLLMHEGK